jgi:hypothetical protein
VTMSTWKMRLYYQRQAGASVRLLDSGDFDYVPSKGIFSFDGPDVVVVSTGDGISCMFTRLSGVVGRSLFGPNKLNDTHYHFEVECQQSHG